MGSERRNRGAAKKGAGRIDRRTFLEVAGVGTALTTVAGCLGGSDDPGGTEGGEDTSGTDDGEDSDDSGGTDSDDGTPGDSDASDQSDESTSVDGTLTIGHLAPTALSAGRGSERSAELAVSELNESDAFDGGVTLVTEDTAASADNAMATVERFVAEDDVDLIVGTYSPGVALGIVDYVADTGVPFVVTGVETTSILRDTVGDEYERYENVFRTGPINADLQAEAMGDYAAFLADRHGWTSFAQLTEDSPWGVPFRNRLPDEFESRGLEVVYADTVALSTDNYAPILDDIASADADALFRFFATAGQGKLLLPWIRGRYEFGLEGIHRASMAPEFWAQTDGACSFEVTAQTGGGGVTELTSRTMPFLEAYRDRYAGRGWPHEPMPMGFNTYDAIHFYARAVTEAGTTDYENRLDDIVDAMLSLEYEGAAGEISLYGESGAYPHDVRPTRDESGAITNLQQIQWQPSGEGEGRQECVFPAQHATADHVRPLWL